MIERSRKIKTEERRNLLAMREYLDKIRRTMISEEEVSTDLKVMKQLMVSGKRMRELVERIEGRGSKW